MNIRPCLCPSSIDPAVIDSAPFWTFCSIMSVHSLCKYGGAAVKTVNFTEFRNNASDLLTQVEQGQSLLVLRHGRPIARISPAGGAQPSWKNPALRLHARGAELASAILQERKRETLP